MNYDKLRKLLGSMEIHDFLRGVHIEAVRQADARYETVPVDWGQLSKKRIDRAYAELQAGNQDKALEHCIEAAAALYNWHCAVRHADIRLAPGRSNIRSG
jgi:hypothetical protein